MRRAGLFLSAGLILGLGALVTATVSSAAEAPVGLGLAQTYGVLAGAGVTNTGVTTINGDLGTCPTPAVTGNPIVTGATHQNDTAACAAKSDFTTAYNDAAGRAPTTTYVGPTDLGSPTPLTAGVYKSPSSFALTGTLTLDAQGDPNAVWIFQATNSTLITAPSSTVRLVNGASACNVFWQVGSSATLDTDTTFVGTILAAAAITLNTRTTVLGRLMAGTESVTLDTNVVTVPNCAAQTTTTGSGPSSTAPTTTVVGARVTTMVPTLQIVTMVPTLQIVTMVPTLQIVSVGPAPLVVTPVSPAGTGTRRTATPIATTRSAPTTIRGRLVAGGSPSSAVGTRKASGLAGTGSRAAQTTATGIAVALFGGIVLIAERRRPSRRRRRL